MCRHFDLDLSEIALHEDCGLLAWSPLTRGILSGKYLNEARPAGARLTLETRPEHRVGDQVDNATKKYVELANRYNLDPCQMALAFVNSRPFVSSTLIGATTMDQLRSNIDSISVTLSEEVLKEIDLVRRSHPMPF